MSQYKGTLFIYSWWVSTGWRTDVGNTVPGTQLSKTVCACSENTATKLWYTHTHPNTLTHNGISSFQHGWWNWGTERHQLDWPYTWQPVIGGWKASVSKSMLSCSHSTSNQPFSLPRIPHSYSLSLSFPPPSPTSAITMFPVERLNLHIYRNMWWVNHSIFFKIKIIKMIQHVMIIFSKFKYSYLIYKQCLHPFQSLSVTRNNDIESSFNEDLKWLLLTKLSEVNKYLTLRYQDIVLCKGSLSRNNQVVFKSIF